MAKPDDAARILVVDDDPDTVSILSRYLAGEGFVPVEAGSGAECLKILQGAQVDLILLDLMMPDMDGFAVVRALKNRPDTAEIPVIMITARDDIEARAEGMRLGVSEFLTKPVLRKQLVGRIHSQLAGIATAHATAEALSRFGTDTSRK